MRSWLWRRCLLIAGAVTVVAGAAGTAAIAQSGLFDASDPGQPLIHHVMTVTAPPPLSNPASFDISWVDPATQTYYLADRTNNGVDAINASTDKFEGVIGQGAFVGNGSGPSLCTPFGTAGPNGILTLNVDGQIQLWAGDGVNTNGSPAVTTSTVKVFDLSSPSTGTLAASIDTGGVCRADELAYDPVDHLVLMANDLDNPPYISLISVNQTASTDTVVAKIPFRNAIDGIEQSVWNPANDLFYVNLPQVAPTSAGQWLGEIALVNPRTMSVVGSFAAPGCSPGGLALDTSTQQMLVGCSSDAINGNSMGSASPAVTLILDARDGHTVASFSQVGGSDEVWLDPASRTFYLAASGMTSNGLSNGYPTPVIGVISEGHGRFGQGGGPQFIENFPTTSFADHSIAANPVNGQVFVPIVTVNPFAIPPASPLSGFGVAVFSGVGGHGH